MTFWSHLFRVQLVRHFWTFFCNYVCKYVKTDPHSEGAEVLKIGQNQASSPLGCLGVPMATKMCPKDVKMMFRGVQNQLKMMLTYWCTGGADCSQRISMFVYHSTTRRELH